MQGLKKALKLDFFLKFYNQNLHFPDEYEKNIKIVAKLKFLVSQLWCSTKKLGELNLGGLKYFAV